MLDIQWGNFMFTIKGLAVLLAAGLVGELIRYGIHYSRSRKLNRVLDMRTKGYEFANKHLLEGGDVEQLRNMSQHGVPNAWSIGIQDAIEDHEEKQHGRQH